ncbi:MAG: hypothetical protein ACLQAT_14885 [Candidatus Binataceae bacterium]
MTTGAPDSIPDRDGEAGRYIRAGISPPRASRWLAWLERNPLAWALPIQGALLFHNLNLLEPWGDEALTVSIVAHPLSGILSFLEGTQPPLFFFLEHVWMRLPFPGGELWSLRAMSVLWALASTAILYRLWLRRLPASSARMVLALWVLSPCLLLYGRMARSYTMQLALALLAISAALKWMEQPRSPLRLMTFCVLLAALLYTHFLPGLAILAAVAIVFAFQPRPPIAVRAMLLGAAVLVIALLYFPILRSIATGLDFWRSVGQVSVGSFLLDQMVRLAWWFVSFSFGESFSTASLILAGALTPVIVCALWRGLRSRPDWLPLVLVASAIGYVGVSRWTGFPFTPARTLFALPFFLMLVANGMGSMPRGSIVFAAVLALYISADYDYFARTGYLNKEYCVPYREIAAVINDRSPAQGAVLLVDETDTFPDPLFPQLNPGVRVIPLDSADSASALRTDRNNPPVIWFLRHTHDTSPNHWVSGLESDLQRGRTVTSFGYLPYSAPEHWILTMLRGPAQPRYFYDLSRFSAKDVDSNSSGIR